MSNNYNSSNHDCNLNNLNRMDCLTPIVDNLNHPNLHYLKEQVFTLVRYRLHCMGCLGQRKRLYKSTKMSLVIELRSYCFMEHVDKCETDLGFNLPSDVKITKFKGYDLGLLGDIHKRQHLNKEETISYCGSLVQQNHGEDIGKGYLLWDVPTRKSKYIEIPNDYGYYTINIDNNTLRFIRPTEKTKTKS